MRHTLAMSSVPATFQQDLGIRGRQNRQQRIGNPYAYLASIGIDAVLEEMYKGANLVDVAEKLDVSVTLLRTWLDRESYWPRVAEATTLSSEGYLSLGMRHVSEAKDKFELDKAKALIEHAKWMASKLNKPTFGTNEVQAAATTVSYVFNVGGDAQIVAAAPQRKAVEVDATSLYLPPAEFTLETVGAQPKDVVPAEVGPFSAEPDPQEWMFAQEWAARGEGE